MAYSTLLITALTDPASTGKERIRLTEGRMLSGRYRYFAPLNEGASTLVSLPITNPAGASHSTRIFSDIWAMEEPEIKTTNIKETKYLTMITGLVEIEKTRYQMLQISNIN
jgi:hypothetical protein